ncbi:hypothetical protein J2Y41_003830 [Arthrobacter sp. 1088]|nr:hypothetical protein [Arthrobacter sp. 1088]
MGALNARSYEVTPPSHSHALAPTHQVDQSVQGQQNRVRLTVKGRLFLYPGDGKGGWLAPKQVGSGWHIFDKIIAPGDTSGDGAVDIFGRDRSGVLRQ